MEIRYKGKVLGSSGGGGGTSEEIYSTEEVRIGTWIDGKPLYQKVYQGVTPSDGTNNVKIVSFDDPTIDKIINFDGKIFTDNGYILELNYCNGINPAYSSAYTQVSAEGVFMTMIQVATRNRPMFIIVQYTKTTDTATISESSSVVSNILASSPMASMPVTAPFLGEEDENA